MMPLPRHLRPLARVDPRSATAVHCHLRVHGEAWLQLWFYGSLINNTVQPLADNPTDSVRLVAATPAGASALFFDGSQHGYEAVFCEHHAHAAPAQTRLWRYSDDVYRIHLQLDYSIDFAAEADTFAAKPQDEIQLADGSWLARVDAQADGFDALTVRLEDSKGHVWTVFAADLA